MKAEDVERIHEASLRILDEVGVRLEHDGIVGRLLAAGARPGRGPHDVRLPPGDGAGARGPRPAARRARGPQRDDDRPRAGVGDRLLDDTGPLPLDGHRAAPGDERGPAGDRAALRPSRRGPGRHGRRHGRRAAAPPRLRGPAGHRGGHAQARAGALLLAAGDGRARPDEARLPGAVVQHRLHRPRAAALDEPRARGLRPQRRPRHPGDRQRRADGRDERAR